MERGIYAYKQYMNEIMDTYINKLVLLALLHHYSYSKDDLQEKGLFKCRMKWQHVFILIRRCLYDSSLSLSLSL